MAEKIENQGHNRICMLEDVVATISVRDEKEQRPLRSLRLWQIDASTLMSSPVFQIPADLTWKGTVRRHLGRSGDCGWSMVKKEYIELVWVPLVLRDATVPIARGERCSNFLVSCRPWWWYSNAGHWAEWDRVLCAIRLVNPELSKEMAREAEETDTFDRTCWTRRAHAGCRGQNETWICPAGDTQDSRRHRHMRMYMYMRRSP